MTAQRQPNRLPDAGQVDKSRPASFKFDGTDYSGFAGDTLASALLASGVRLIGRSFKYHRPRGVLTAGSEEPNALVELGAGAYREPNTRATTIELFDGLEAASQNRWPSLKFDVAAISELLSPILVAGFYYKTFMRPSGLWERLYEPAIRRAAGLGSASMLPDPDTYETSHAFCDVLVIGAGPAGLAAALSAGRSGARVILCDEDFRLGGRLNGERRVVDGQPGSAWAGAVADELKSLPNVQLLPRTTVFGAYDGGVYGALERVSDHQPRGGAQGAPRQRLWKITSRRSILAAGAVERPICFPGNDRPGVMMASAVRTYLNRFGVVPGRQPVVFTASDDGWATAFDLHEVGGVSPIVVDTRSEVGGELVDRARAAGLETIYPAQVVDTSGYLGLSSVSIRTRSGTRRVPADLLAVSGGWNPSLAISTHLGGRPVWRDDLAGFVPGTAPKGMVVAGAAMGSFSLRSALHEGSEAGRLAAQECGRPASAPLRWTADDEPATVSPVWQVQGGRSKAFVDLQNDVTVKDVQIASREGFRSVEHLKRYTTLGMGTDQGKTSNVVGLAILASLTDRTIREVGVTTARPPYVPIAIGAFAGPHKGRDYRPTRLTPSHSFADGLGAEFVETGPWLRAQWFTRESDRSWRDAVAREVNAVRTGAGVCDVSTLGKIDLQGPDAAAFLDKVYINTMSALAPGKAKYGVMLREDGIVLDDGTVAHLTDGHYVISTTTANAARVMQHLEHARQVTWPDLDVQLASVTEQWAQFALAGPQARAVLQSVLGDAYEVSNHSLPFMGCASFVWRGVTARLFRISFSGELAYELAVPADVGEAVMAALVAAGASPYGTEALGVMRIEKGHAAGPELNGTTTAADLGLGRMMAKKKDCIGAILSRRPGLSDPNRGVLVGVRPVEAGNALNAGAHLVNLGGVPTLEADQGYLTSAAFSPTLGHYIALALLARGAERMGERMTVHDPLRGQDVPVEVCHPAFLDPEGARLHV